MNVSDLKSLLSGANITKASQNTAAQPFISADALGRNAEANSAQSPAALSHIDMNKMTRLSASITLVNHQVLGRLDETLNQGEVPVSSDKSEVEALFDFKSVITNVLDFVKNAIYARKEDGADDEELKDMLAQARKGVDIGFADARKELDELGEMNDDLEQGISKAYEGIHTGLNKLDEELFAQQPTELRPTFYQEIAAQQRIDSSLSVTTADGDTVTINFSRVTSLQQQEQVQGQNDDGQSVRELTDNQQNRTSINQQLIAAADQVSAEGIVANTSFDFSSQIQQTTTSNYQQDGETASRQSVTEYYQAVNFSFNVEGELDQEELQGIATLVQDISALVDEFVRGEPDKAFEKALSLGIDDEQIAAFSYQHTQIERYRSMQVYQEMNRLAESPAEAIKEQIVPIAKYSTHLLALVEAVNLRLSSQVDSQALLDMVTETQLQNDTNKAEMQNRFAQFNQQLLTLLPNASKPVAN